MTNDWPLTSLRYPLPPFPLPSAQIDIKADNNPDRLFRLMKKTVESYPDYATNLSPRLILGLWHPVFLDSALEHVPTLRRVHIGGSPTTARTYFWKHCDGFSMWFPSLVGTEGQSFIQQARDEGKDVFVWTVNRRDEMIEATRWGVKAILTDKTDMFQDVRRNMKGVSLCAAVASCDLASYLTLSLFSPPLHEQPTMSRPGANKLVFSLDGAVGSTTCFLNS
jgi:hypothetical protein